MNSDFDISVITATYNRQKFIDDCIKSVQSSVFPTNYLRVEHIVVDDGSTDDTVRQIKENYNHIRLIELPNNKGASFARNVGIEHASGEYIFVLDSDDILLQAALNHLYKALQSNSEHDWAYGDFLRVDKELRHLPNQDYYGWHFDSPEKMLDAIFSGGHFMQHSALFQKKLFDAVGGYDETLTMAEDLDLFIRFIKHSGIPLYTGITTHLHRIHDNNISNVIDIKHRDIINNLSLKYRG